MSTGGGQKGFLKACEWGGVGWRDGLEGEANGEVWRERASRKGLEKSIFGNVPRGEKTTILL
jgi:hypothetical protein